MKQKVQKLSKKALKLFLSIIFALILSTKPVFADSPSTLLWLQVSLSSILYWPIRLGAMGVFLMFLFGGFKYLTSGGDPKQAEAAKATITNAIIGFVVLFMIWIALEVIQNITGVNVTQFELEEGVLVTKEQLIKGGQIK